MKTLVTILMFSALWLNSSAQIPRKMSYQAVIRDTEGNLVTNRQVGMLITILQGELPGIAVYQERQTPFTNANGLATVEIGIDAGFEVIEWGNNIHYISTETDPEGGTNYTISGTSQLLSVPYAFHARNVEEERDGDPVNEIQEIFLNGNQLTLSKEGGSVELPIPLEGDNWGSQVVVTNPTLSGQGTAGSPLKIAQQSASTGQVLKWNGTTWGPSADNEGGLTLPYSGTGTSGGPLFNIVNLGTSGAISTFSNGNYAIWGESSNSTGIGVYGVNKTSGGATYGVFGDVYSPTGYSGYFQGGKFYVEGNVGIGTLNPSAKLEVTGQVKITGGNPGTGKVLTSDAAGLAAWQLPEPNPWLKNGSNVYYNSGDVGIGLNNPAGMMEIYGNSVDNYPTLLLSEANGYARVSFRTMPASAKHWVLAGHTNASDATSQWHLNYNNGTAGKNILSVFGDSRIAFDGNVGIGTQAPGAKLDVAGQVKITGGNPGTGKVLTSDANGLASWITPASSSGPWLTSGSNVYYNTGNVGIGTNSPAYKLSLYDPENTSISLKTSGSVSGFVIQTLKSGLPVYIWNFDNSNMHFATNNLNRMIINADGHISMMSYLDLNTDGTFGALSVKGKQALWWDGTYFSWGYDGEYNYFADKVTIGNPSNPGYMLYVQGSAFATGSWSSSDARYKKNIMPIGNALNRIMTIRGTTFEFRGDEFKDYQFADGKQFGFIAQELEDVFPEVVRTESNGYRSLNYNGMIPVLLEGIKEMQAEIETLKEKLAKLEVILGERTERKP